MVPTKIKFDELPNGELIRLAFSNEIGSSVPTYSKDPGYHKEFKRAGKAARYVFQINKNGWCGLKVYNHAEDCIVKLEGTNATNMVQKELTLKLEENQSIYAIKMQTEGDYVQAAQFILCKELG